MNTDIVNIFLNKNEWKGKERTVLTFAQQDQPQCKFTKTKSHYHHSFYLKQKKKKALELGKKISAS